MRFDRALTVSTLILAVAANAAADEYQIFTDIADHMTTSDNQALTGTIFGVVGGNSSPGNGRNSVFYFPLPVLQPGEQIVSARATFHYLGGAGSLSFNVDAYLDGFVTGPITPIVDYAEGPDWALSTKIADNLIQPLNPSNQRYATSSAPDSVLAQSLRFFYQGNPNYSGGVSAVVHLIPDASPLPATTTAYTIAMREDSANGAQLIIETFIPEPTMLGAAVGLAPALLRRRPQCEPR